jgi:hypothetical protein
MLTCQPTKFLQDNVIIKKKNQAIYAFLHGKMNFKQHWRELFDLNLICFGVSSY